MSGRGGRVVNIRQSGETWSGIAIPGMQGPLRPSHSNARSLNRKEPYVTFVSANGNYSGLSVPTADTHGGTMADSAESTSGVHIAKADGLHGRLGLYEVTTNGATQFMTREEATKMDTVSDPAPGNAAPDSLARVPQAATAPRGGGLWSWMLEIYMEQLGKDLNEAANKL